MPEGNTIHRLARIHTRDFGGRRVRVASPQGRFANEAARLDGRRFRFAEAYGKHLFHHWSEGLVVHVHLGMAGWFYRFRAPAPAPRPTVRMRLSAAAVTADLIGPPACELVSEEERAAIVARLGPDPLRRDFDPGVVWTSLRMRPRRAIGDVLLDQRVLAGAGNIYRNEALFLAGVHPLRPSGKLTEAEWDRLWRTIRRLMRRGVAQAQIRTVERGERPHQRSGREPEYPFYVYQAESCLRCAAPIREFSLSGRRMFACVRCQPRRAPAREPVAEGTCATRRRAPPAP
jgi:endonuclease-8